MARFLVFRHIAKPSIFNSKQTLKNKKKCSYCRHRSTINFELAFSNFINKDIGMVIITEVVQEKYKICSGGAFKKQLILRTIGHEG